MLGDAFKLIGATIDLMTNGPSPILERTKVKGLIVSTVITQDMGPETAIIDMGSAHPVERYTTEEETRVGHQRWVALVEGGLEKITKLGYGSVIDPKEVILQPEQ